MSVYIYTEDTCVHCTRRGCPLHGDSMLMFTRKRVVFVYGERVFVISTGMMYTKAMDTCTVRVVSSVERCLFYTYEECLCKWLECNRRWVILYTERVSILTNKVLVHGEGSLVHRICFLVLLVGCPLNSSQR